VQAGEVCQIGRVEQGVGKVLGDEQAVEDRVGFWLLCRDAPNRLTEERV
jgi:hypothetical protein